MYRLLIVDDEPVIVDSLGQLFREQNPELDVCQAYSAIEALEWIKRAKVDIVISDIRMPEKNGLQLIDELMHYWPSCKVVFLTGYDEFDYVYSAIRKNADFYILKTEDDVVLLEAVHQCIRQLDEENARVGMLEAARSQIMLTGPLFRKQLLEAALHGEDVKDLIAESDDWTGDSAAGERLALKLDARNPVLLLACRVDSWRPEATYGRKLQTYYSIQHVVEERMAKSVVRESLIFGHELIVWFLQPDPEANKFYEENGSVDWRGLSVYLSGVLESVQQDCGEEAGENPIFVIAKQAAEWEGVHREFDLLRQFLKRRLFPNHASAVIDLGAQGGLEARSAETRVTPMLEFKRKLHELEKSLDGEEEDIFERICRELLADIREQIGQHYLTGTEKYYGFLLVFLGAMDALEVEQMSMTDIPTDWSAAAEHFVGLGRRICADKRQRRDREGDALIRRLQSYVQDNLHSDLSLVRIAEVTFFNPSYLSRLYKQHTGTNLSDYIHAARLEAAKRMLEQPGMKANDIADKLGFSSPSYFSTFFRKMTGRTPQEYREDLASSGRKSTK
ncbi:helix-turn-helix domain-containing protein [Cohnella herbarum]|uniref:Helix-turn-helix domain-containing protein n=1 Tax=Cohnella herbarum TaxID=2728023 RepID=A0A7Z2VNS4_9BACL|nr:helix-turn-helix domain-containing protein [Cohnella herbarum]QJD86401.1 helix-turn-helix domain-containing protein [Cohnella herbarum]